MFGLFARLTSSCFAELSLDKVKLEEFDSDEQDDDLEVLTGDAGNLPEGWYRVQGQDQGHLSPLDSC